MPLKELGPPSRWHWREAIAWIAFNIPDAGSSFWLSKPTIEQIGIEKPVAQIRARRAVEELVAAVREGQIHPIWIDRRAGHRGDEPDGWFQRWASETEEIMIDRLNGIINLSGCPLAGLRFDRAAIVEGWPEAITPGQQQSSAGAGTRCRKWLVGLMRDGPKTKSKSRYRDEAKNTYGVGTRAFNKAWEEAISETGKTDWSNPGRIS